MAEDEIESVKRHSAQREKLWNRWAEYAAQLDEYMNDDNVHAELHDARFSDIAKLVHHFGGQHARDASMRRAQHMLEVHIVDLTKSHNPTKLQIGVVVLQILGALAAGAVGVTPALAGYTGQQAAAYQAGSNTISGVFVSGGQSVGSLLHSRQQGLQAKYANILEAERRLLSQEDQERSQRTQSMHSHDEDVRKKDQNKHDSMKNMMAG